MVRVERRSNGAGEVVGDRCGYGTADQVHLADVLDALFRLVIDFEHEAKDVARIDEANNDDVSRIRNRVEKENLGDTRLDELVRSVFQGGTVDVRVPFDGSQRPEIAIVVFQDLQIDQVIQGQINDRLRMDSEPFNPVLGASLSRFVRDLPENGIQRGVARLCAVHKVQ